MQFSQPFNEPTTGTHSQPPPPRFLSHGLETAAARRVEEEFDAQEIAPALDQGDATAEPQALARAERTRLFAQLDLHTESNFFVGFSGDLSDGGLFITSYQPLRVGEAVQVELCLAGHFVSVSGRVVWRRVPHHGRLDLAPGAGIVLEGLDPALRVHIEQFMDRREPWFVDPEVLPLRQSQPGDATFASPREDEPALSEAEPKGADSAPAPVAGSVRPIALAAPSAPSASNGKSRRSGRKQRRSRGSRKSKH